jgi:hypothetical protein
MEIYTERAPAGNSRRRLPNRRAAETFENARAAIEAVSKAEGAS